MKAKFFSIASVSFLVDLGKTELTILDMRGIDQLIDHPGASPVFGYIALKTFLPNRRFLGNYGESTQPHRGMCAREGRVPDILRRKKDCPLDANAAWIQRLFPSHDGVNFVTNQQGADIISHLTPRAIGAVLQRIAEVADSEWFSHERMSVLRRELGMILFYHMNYEKFVDSHLDELQKKAVHRKKRGQEALNLIGTSLEDWEDMRPEIVKSVKALIESVGTAKVARNLRKLTERLIGAPPDLVNDVFGYIYASVHVPNGALRLVRDEAKVAPDLELIETQLEELVKSNAVLMEEVNRSLNSIDPQTRAEVELWNELKRRERVMGIYDETGTVSKFGDRSEFAAIADLLVDALIESRGTSQHYPKLLPEHALLAFFVNRADTKDDVIDLLRGMPRLVKDGRILGDTDTQFLDSFRNSRWSPRLDFDPHLELGDPRKGEVGFVHAWDGAFVKELLGWSVEKLLFHFIMIDYAARDTPRVFSYAVVEHELPSGEVIKFADCGETSVRNFFNIVLYDRDSFKFRADLFDSFGRGAQPLQGTHSEGAVHTAAGENDLFAHSTEELDLAQQIDINPALRHFYETYSDPLSAAKQTLRVEWALNVVAGKEGVTYNTFSKDKEGFEIRSLGNPDNMLNLLGQLLLKESVREIWNQLRRNEKLDTLCRIISRPDRRFSWRPSDMSIAFDINDEPVFEWLFDENHFAITDLTWASSQWQRIVVESISPALTDNSGRSFLLPILFTESSFVAVRDIVSTESLIHLMFACNAGDVESRVRLFEQIITSDLKIAILLKPLADKLRAKVPESTDIYTRRSIHRALVKAQYPYYDGPMHALGRPDAVYTKMTFAGLSQMFSDEIARAIGPSWSRRLFGNDLIITDFISARRGDRGKLRATGSDSIKLCNALNDKSKRRRVLTQLVIREAVLSKMRHRRDMQHNLNTAPVDFCSLNSAVAMVYKAMPVEGFHAMGVEEWACIYSDMGKKGMRMPAPDSQYIEQFIASPFGFFWTSSMSPFGQYQTSNGDITLENFVTGNHRPQFVRCGFDVTDPTTTGTIWSKPAAFSVLAAKYVESDSYFPNHPEAADVMRTSYKTRVYTREIIIGSPNMATGMSWQSVMDKCNSLNKEEERSQIQSEFSERTDRIRAFGINSSEALRAARKGGFFVLSVPEWEHVFTDLVSHPEELEFLARFLEPDYGCNYYTSDHSGFSCRGIESLGENDRAFRCAYLRPLEDTSADMGDVQLTDFD